MVSRMTRRRFVGVTGGSIASVVLAGCGSSSSDEGSGSWTFTDDRGVKVSLKARPTKVVAYDLAASALMHAGVKPAGVFASFPFDKNAELEGLDLSGVAKVGEAYGKLNLETLAATGVDLVVTIFDPRLTGPVIGFPDKATQAKVQRLAPVVAIDATKQLSTVIARFEALAGALGADLKAPLVSDARKRFADAEARARRAIAAKPGLTAVAFAAYKGYGLNFARPAEFPILAEYAKLGLKLVKVGGTPGDINKAYDSFFYENVSFEQADKYPADLMLYDDKPAAMHVKELEAIPTMRRLPAAQAGQLAGWISIGGFSHELAAQRVETLAEAVEHAHVLKA
jgi:iron complex transport system substrate-binding protein